MGNHYLGMRLILFYRCFKENYINRLQEIVFCLDNLFHVKKLFHKNAQILATLQNILFKKNQG